MLNERPREGTGIEKREDLNSENAKGPIHALDQLCRILCLSVGGDAIYCKKQDHSSCVKREEQGAAGIVDDQRNRL